MKKTWWIDVLRNIEKTLLIFISIGLVLTVGITEYTSMQNTTIAMLQSAGDYLKEKRLYDLKLNATTGFSQDDINKIQSLDSITAVTGEYSSDVYLHTGDAQNMVIRCSSTSGDMNLPTISAGRMPQDATECAIDSVLAAKQNYHVGNSLTVQVPQSYPISPLINTTLTICGIADLPSNFKIKGNIGDSTPLGTGTVDATMILDAGAFNTSYFQNRFSDLYVRADIPKVYEDSYKVELSHLKTLVQGFDSNWFISTARDNSGVIGFEFGAQLTEKASDSLSFIFIFIVVLMTYTAVSSIINKQRKDIGSQKAQGFRKYEVFLKYLVYAFCLVPISLLVGTLLAKESIEPTLFKLSSADYYTMKQITTVIEPTQYLMVIIVVLLSTLLPAYLACRKIVSAQATVLLKDEVPVKNSSTSEKSFFLFSWMPFSSQVSIKNMIQNKIAVLTSLAGVIGCTALIVCGLNLPPMFVTAMTRQEGQIQNYRYIVTTNSYSTPEQATAVRKTFSEIDQLSYLPVMEASFIINSEIEPSQTKVLISENDTVEGYLTLRDVNNVKETLSIPQDGALISEKAAIFYGLIVGDFVSVTDAIGKKADLRVSGIFKNFIGNTILMSSDYYAQAFGKPAYNSYLIKIDSAQEANLCKELQTHENAFSVTRSNYFAYFESTIDNLNGISFAMTILALFLAIAVLFNMAAINIEKRTRELAVMKAFGYQKMKLAIYLYRETLLVNIIGVILGMLIGLYWAIHVGHTLAPQNFMIADDVGAVPTLLGGLIAFLFAFVANLLTFGKIKRLDLTRINK